MSFISMLHMLHNSSAAESCLRKRVDHHHLAGHVKVGVVYVTGTLLNAWMKGLEAYQACESNVL